MEAPRDPMTEPSLAARLLAWLRPTRVSLTPDAPRYLANRIIHQFEDEMETRKLKAIQL